MVLEQMFRAKWLEKRPRYAFGLGLVYAFVGIISASLIFGSNPGYMTVAFAAILLIPSLNNLLSDEENVEIRENKFDLKTLFLDHYDIFEIYLFMFLGVFVTFVLVTISLPHERVLSLFAPQLKFAGITGFAFNAGLFSSIVLNNIKVLLVCLILSLVYGAGSILFIVWNASVWGVVFGYIARSSVESGNPYLFFMTLIIPVLPHMITEAVSYFSAAIAGGVVSKGVLREKFGSKRFKHLMSDALIIVGIGFILVVIAALLEVTVGA